MKLKSQQIDFIKLLLQKTFENKLLLKIGFTVHGISVKSWIEDSNL